MDSEAALKEVIEHEKEVKSNTLTFKKVFSFLLIVLISLVLLGGVFYLGRISANKDTQNLLSNECESQVNDINNNYSAAKEKLESLLDQCALELAHTKDFTNTLMGRLENSEEKILEDIETYKEEYDIAEYDINSELLEGLEFTTTEFSYKNHKLYKRSSEIDSVLSTNIWEFNHERSNLLEAEIFADFLVEENKSNELVYASDIIIDNELRYINTSGLEFYILDLDKDQIRIYTYQHDLPAGNALLIELVLEKEQLDTETKIINKAKELSETFVQL